MLGYSCLAHSYWQRCHKTGLRGAVSGEEESGGEANQERTICMSSRLLPSGSLSLSLSLCNISSLHCIIHSFAKAIKCQDIRLPQAVSLAFPLPARSPASTTTRCEIGGKRKKKKKSSWWSWRAMSGGGPGNQTEVASAAATAS